MRRNTRNNSTEALLRARDLRSNMTISEDILWEFVRKRRIGGFLFKRQVPVGPYFLDFYCPPACVALEVDGPLHDAQKDRVRDEWLGSRGIVVFRIPTALLFDDPASTALGKKLTELEELLRGRISPPPAPSSSSSRGRDI